MRAVEVKYFLRYTLIIYLMIFGMVTFSALLILYLSYAVFFFNITILIPVLIVLNKLNKKYAKFIKKSTYVFKINYLIIAFILPLLIIFPFIVFVHEVYIGIAFILFCVFFVNNIVSAIRHAITIYE
jgi:hypothetical protein